MSPKGERTVNPVSHSQVKIGTEDWVLKGTKLITNTKKQRLKISSRGWILKNAILKKRLTKFIKKIYMKFALKNRVSLFLQSNSRL